jgi:hypothetical protein
MDIDPIAWKQREVGFELRQVHDALRRARGLIADGVGNLRPFVEQRAVDELKFSEMLPPLLARQTLEQRMADPNGARVVIDQPVIGGVEQSS